MPGIENWVNSPLPVIQRLFAEANESDDTVIEEYFRKRIQAAQDKGQIPSLNDVPTHNLPTNSIVRFRGMVQDMHDPEFFLGVYEVENQKTGQKYLKCGKYRDLADCGAQEEIRLDSGRNKTMERQTYYCVPLPGESSWVKEGYAKVNGSSSACTPSTSSVPERLKRGLEEDDETQNLGAASMDTDTTNNSSSDESKKSKPESDKDTTAKAPLDLNFPLPGETGPSCIVKIYSSDESIKLNDMVEIVGVLSNDPAMASFPEKEKQKSSLIDPDAEMMEILEADEDANQACPPSLVPRLHALSLRKLGHNNPLLPQTQDQTEDAKAVDDILAEAETLRSTLLSVLQKLLFGDGLAAEYLLCHLVSGVYARHDVVSVGKCALNLSGCPRSGPLPKLIHGFIKELVTKSHFFPMSLDNMNKLPFVPEKDYKANRLKSGLLQLCEKTHLILDETALQPGQLNTNGVGNMTALGNVIQWQKVDYNFNFHRQEFKTDIIVLILSEGKSILKCDSQVPIVARQGGFPTDIEAHFTSVLSQELSSLDLMNKLRTYISLVQILQYNLPEQLQQEIEQDFVDTRKSDQSKMSIDDFHGLLVLARLLSLTHGKKTLTKEIWERAKVLEVERKTRIVVTNHD